MIDLKNNLMIFNDVRQNDDIIEYSIFLLV